MGIKQLSPINTRSWGILRLEKTIEIETEVGDFGKASEIFSKIKFKEILYQENKRQIFHLNEIEFSIDSWPKIKPFLEIEAKSLEKVREGLKLLGLEGKDVGDKDIVAIYQEEVGFDPNSVSELKFEN
jgi:adenylate cyclase class 2